MKKILLLIPFILAIYAVSSTVVDRSFSSKKVILNTRIFKSLDSRQTVNRAPVKQVRVVTHDFRDVENLNFTAPIIKINKTKKLVIAKKERIEFNQKVLNKEIKIFELKKEKINVVAKKINKTKINKKIIELDITEKVNVYAYSKIKVIKKTNWSAIFEYSPVIIKQPRLAKVEQYYENKETPIRISEKKVKKVKLNNLIKKSDRISTKLAATEKSSASKKSESKISSHEKRELEVKIMKNEKKNDLVFFDYSAAENDLNTQKIAKVKVKKPISKVIIQTKVSKKIEPPLNFNNISGAKRSDGPIEPKQNQIPKIVKHDPETIKMAENFLSTHKSAKPFIASKNNYNSDYSIQPYNVNGTKVQKDVMSFEVRFDDDIDDIVQSYGEGEINLKTKINTEMSIRRGTIYSASHYPTTVDFVLENNEIVAKIPLMEKDYLNKLITKNKVTGFGSQLLIELDNKTEDVDIDAPFERKLFLNKKLQQVERGEDDYTFILFIGAETGNTIISFKTINNKIVSKIIHLEDSELYYEPNFYIEVKTDEFELTEEYLLSKEKGPLSLDPNQITGLTFDEKFKKLTSNRYKVKNVLYPLGMRSYIELKHLNESIYVGRWNSKVASVPSEQYMRYVLNKFRITNVGSNCLVQINLPKKASELYFNGQSKNGIMRMQSKILDKDGIFYTDLSNESEKIFLLGEEQGIINVKIKYIDGSFDFLQSYCSDNTYLVEEL